MEFETLEEAQRLSVRYDGPDLDAFTFGVIQINIHEITNHVATSLLVDEGLLKPPVSFRYIRYKRSFEYFYPRPLVRARIGSVRSGSIEQEIGFAVASVIADPDVRAVLQSLSASVIFAMAESGVRNIRTGMRNIGLRSSESDPYDVGSNIRDISVAALENSNGQAVSLKFRSETSDGVDEVEIAVGGEDGGV